jgi:hypothetical protein
MHRVIAGGMDMTNLSQHLLCSRRWQDIISGEDALSSLSFMKGRLPLKETGMIGDELGEFFR